MSWFKNLFGNKNEEKEVEMKGSEEEERRVQEEQASADVAADAAQDRQRNEQRVVSIQKEIELEQNPIEKIKKEIELTEIYSKLNPDIVYYKERLKHLREELSNKSDVIFWKVGNGGKKKSKRRKSNKSKSKRTKSKQININYL
jgi:hypothetical protein